MFGKVAAFEFRYQIKNPVFWVSAGVFFLLTFGSVVIDQIRIGGGGNIHKNAPFAIAQTHLIWTIFYMFVSTAFVSNVIVRDDETGFGGILRSTRVKRFDYLYGRFAGAFAAAMLAYLAVPLAMVIGSFMPWVDKEVLGPLTLQPFLFSYFVLALPNILLTSALFFALATVTRSMMWTYVGVIGFLVVWTTANIMLDKPELEKLVALWEPLGFGAFGLITKYWTATERNALVPAVEGLLLYNRLFTLALSAAALALPMLFFHFTPGQLKGKRARQARIAAAAAPVGPPPEGAGVHHKPSFGLATAWAQLRVRTRLDMGQVFGSPAYLVLLGLGLFNSVGALWGVTDDTGYGGQIYPVTRALIPALMGSFSLIPMIIAIYYAGELVWRERDKKTHEIIDATPVPDWAFVAPKTLAISLVLISTLLISVVAGVAIQALKGFDTFELNKWLVWYVLPQAVDWVLVAVLAVFIQAISPHKFVGWGLMVLYLITSITFGNLGFDHILYNYGATPNDGGPGGMPMSDINGLGRFWIGAWVARAYWSAFAIVLLVLSYGLWRRGTEMRLWPRLRRLPRRLTGKAGVLFAIAVIGAAGLGCFIYVNTNVWNQYRTALDDDKWQADFEKVLLVQRHYDKVPQPKILSMKLEVDLRPHEPRLTTSGTYVLVNTTNAPLREVHVLFDRDLKVNGLSIEGARPKGNDPELARFNYRIFTFDQPMQPGEQRKMSFLTERSQRGFKNRGNEMRVVDNGTFVDSGEFTPQLGVWPGGGLQDRAKRRKYGLNPDLPVTPLGDVPSRQFNYLRHDADFMTSDITISTEADQTPIAPGKRVSDKVVGGRRVARFVTQAPVLPFFAIQSARYKVSREIWKGVELEVYYDPAHPYNVERMKTAMKTALDYYGTHFSPYQYDYMRFIEFPGYASFAQAFPGSMPWSENLFFVADYRDPEKIDMVTYVGSHEIGHQWWAYQVIGADQQGMTLLSETMAQYSALRVMKRLYGEDQIRKFLKYELNSYLRARGGQPLEEKPLNRVQGSQGYIHYRKGSLVMYRLAEEIGEDRVNHALSLFLQQHAFKGAPYPISSDLIALFRAEVPGDKAKQDLITDLFEKIVLYDVKVVSSTAKARKDGRFDVSIVVDARKLEADGKGKETARTMDEMVDVGVFTAQPGQKDFKKTSVLKLERRPIRTGRQTLTFTVDKRPTYVGVDPYNILIDRNSDDNVAKAGVNAG
ncbi:aminopeptidase N [Caulobacter ginsengisoli]|uniref:Aminopeptidase N n=1 Tax=Caulobacter ginsengisoli TaxID=400775 RepID=A0ABU0IU46_9CAUL|nr:M1 family aminopeptidase [Caulobacter ginsengisoli]MDQ0464881.1 aminopeptidase N [Caulobacter ginsengisoli]